MTISHIALFVSDLEKMKKFYEYYFNAEAGPKYSNRLKEFESYFLSFDNGTSLELMQKKGIDAPNPDQKTPDRFGYAHVAFSVGSEAGVDRLTLHMSGRGITVLSAPRWTGDGCYESVIVDPEGNILEITV